MHLHARKRTAPSRPTAPPPARVRRESGALVDMTVDAIAELSEPQQRVLHLVNARRHVFLTGCAGSGKSKTVIALMEGLARSGAKCEITASTAMAAQNVVGGTLHALLKLNPFDFKREPEMCAVVKDLRLSGKHVNAATEEGKHASEVAACALRRLYRKENTPAKDKLVALEVLVIDEVSMVSALTLYTAMVILRTVRGGSMPVIILTGDFAQLQPVAGDVALDSTPWKLLAPEPVVLTESFRQRHDQSFLEVLNESRMGMLSPRAIALLRARESAVMPEEYREGASSLLAYRKQVEDANAAHLRSLPGEESAFVAQMFIGTRVRGSDWTPVTGSTSHRLESLPGVQVQVPATATARHVMDIVAPAATALAQTALAKSTAVLVLKIGAKVMFTASCGFGGGGGAAAACGAVDGGGSDASGAGSAAAGAGAGAGAGGAGASAASATSRPGGSRKPLAVNGTRGVVVDFQPYPVVRLQSGDLVEAVPVCRVQPVDGIEQFVSLGKVLPSPQRQREKLLQEGPALVCSQVPLMLAHAMTIHQAQGMTLVGPTFVSLDVFAKGQAYVALSRFTKWEDVYIKNFFADKVKADPDVVKWYTTHSRGWGSASVTGSGAGAVTASASASASAGGGVSAGGGAGERGISAGGGGGGGGGGGAGAEAEAEAKAEAKADPVSGK